MTDQPRTPLNNLALVSLIIAVFLPPVGAALGVLAREQTAETGERGRGLATVGVVLSAAVHGVALLLVVAWVCAAYWIGAAYLELYLAAAL